MNTVLQPVTNSTFRIHPESWPGIVHLTVANLEKQIAFYQNTIGLQLHGREGKSARLGAGQADLLHLTEVSDARRYRGTTGLYHMAFLLPNRRELARVIGRFLNLKYTNYPTDHILTKSVYLDDLEGNNIEVYTESPEDGIFGVENGNIVARRADGSLSDGREPMDLDELFTHLSADDQLDAPIPIETKMGHVHLFVANLSTTRHFYHEQLGMDDMGVAQAFRMGMVSAGGYHHHIGYNTWQGEGALPPPPNHIGMSYFTFNLPSAGELDRMAKHMQQIGLAFERRAEGLFVRDPSQNGIIFTTHEL
ncbi:MAG: glyoxalase [Chloroflexi bacterium HGW-Chloroflexi-8]|jgi:catechol 2,3-dioxygenase|nr:MAG: glyoxalase [Chloroflexi bacterium HGW-Chloroflexi-8]